MAVDMVQLVCSPSYCFLAREIAKEWAPLAEVVVDHYAPGNFLYIFEEGKAPAGIDIEAIKLREAQA